MSRHRRFDLLDFGVDQLSFFPFLHFSPCLLLFLYTNSKRAHRSTHPPYTPPLPPPHKRARESEDSNSEVFQRQQGEQGQSKRSLISLISTQEGVPSLPICSASRGDSSR